MAARSLALCLAPLALIVGFTALSGLQAKRKQAAHRAFFARSSASDPAASAAYQTADSFVVRLFGMEPSIRDASLFSSQTTAKNQRLREWSVLCATRYGDYLLRIDADSNRVYAVNRMVPFDSAGDDTNGPGEHSEPDPYGEGQPEAPLSQTQAQVQAFRYLHLLGIPTGGLQVVSYAPRGVDGPPSPDASHTWNFAFHKQGDNTPPIMVAVNSKDGELQSIWSSAAPI